jgi:hypothetical protein
VRKGGGLEARFRTVKQWIVNVDTDDARSRRDRGEPSRVWEAAVQGLNTLLEPYRFHRVDGTSYEVLFTTPTGVVPIEALSSGFRSVFVIVAEMLLRLSLGTPEGDSMLQQEATCLIDEIDAHLHPAWQQNVIPGLRELFPNVQIIATTHSPLVVASVEPYQVFKRDCRGRSSFCRKRQADAGRDPIPAHAISPLLRDRRSGPRPGARRVARRRRAGPAGDGSRRSRL